MNNYCGNPECSMAGGLVRTKLIIRYFDDETTLTCGKCKQDYDYELRDDKVFCNCGKKLKFKKYRTMKCPKCNNRY